MTMTKRLQYPSSSDGWCAACGEGWGDAGVHCSECGACHTRVWADESHDPSPEARLAAARPEDRLRADKWQAAIARRYGKGVHDGRPYTPDPERKGASDDWAR